MRRSFWLVVLSVLAMTVRSESEAADPVPTLREWTVEGVKREALVYVPTTATTEPTPLIFAFHGHGGTMNHAARTFAYHKLWPEALVVTMQGLPTVGAITDPEGKRPGWQRYRGDQGDRDLKFFDAVLASMKADYKVDSRRIYATGHSNGGSFTYLLWAERDETIAAVAPSAAVPGRSMKNLKPKPALHVAGEADELVKFPWQQRTMQAVRKLNGCDSEGREWAKEGSLVATIYHSKTGTPFVTAISPGGHVVPKEAPKLIVKFFQENPKL
jgi:polyhydroxybutyrate depolymerase